MRLHNTEGFPLSGSADVQLVSRIAGILSALSVRDAGSLVEISSACGLPVSTTSRLLDSLEREGFVERDYASKKYCLGSRLLSFAAGRRPRKDLASVLHPTLEVLSEETGEDAGIAELHGRQAVMIDRVEGHHALRIIDVINRPEPLYCGASRKVLLAFQTDEWIEGYIKEIAFIPFTENTIRSQIELWREITRIRRQGFAKSFGERLVDAAGAAAPIFDHAGTVRAAIHIAGPKTRINAKTAEFYTTAVKKAGETATRLLSGRGWSGRASYPEVKSTEFA
jgi:IclR family KDG regulon transcriptional repressor